LIKKKLFGLSFAFLLLCAPCASLKAKIVSKNDISKKSVSKKSSSAVVERKQLFSVGESEADLFWQTSEPVYASVSYGEDKNNLRTITIRNRQKNHYLRLKNLKSETTYYYKINGVKDSKLESFKTLAKPGGRYLFSFAVCTDIHLSNSKLDQFGALYKESWDIFNNLIKEVNKEKVDFLVIKGDISHNSESQDYQAFTETISRLNCKTYVVPGNHDKQHASWGLFFRFFSPNSSSYFSLDHKTWHFIFLDSASEELDRGYFGSDELSWLESDLRANSSKPTMIFMHHLALKAVIPQARRFFIENSEEFKKIINPYPVIAVHSGHAHLNNVSSYGNTDYIVSGAVINYPIQYNVYHVYENGYVQVCHRLSSYLDQGEASKKSLSSVYSAYFGVKPNLVTALVEGTLEDRSFVRRIK
jgi:hypothetical protein